MKAHKNWSYAPYRPPFIDCGDIYICRLVALPTSIHLEWLSIGEETYEVFCRVRGGEDFAKVGETKACEFTIEGLTQESEYEFYVQVGKKKSRVRLARCGEVVGTVVNYLHPEDDVYAFSGRCLCSPSLVRHPDGYLLAAMDVFKGGYPQNLEIIFRSDDDGKTWHYVSELFPCFWGKMFLHKGDLYMLGCSTEYGDLLIGKSTDGGKTFTEPTVLFRGQNGKNGEVGVHKNPQPVVEHNGRLWNTMEWGSWGRGYHAVMVMSVPVDDDLLDADNWAFSEPVKYDPNWEGLPKGDSPGNIEGALVVRPDGFYNIMRYQMGNLTPNYGLILAYKVNTEDPEAPLTFDHAISFPANHSKFMIKQHPVTKKYYSVATRIIDADHSGSRNLLSLMVSEDCEHWEVERDIYDYLEADPQKVGFQYVDFEIEGDEIIFLCRTAMNDACNYHDSNYSTFDRIKLK